MFSNRIADGRQGRRHGWSRGNRDPETEREEPSCIQGELEMIPTSPKEKPSIVSPQEWEAARQQLLVKEKAFTRSRDALAAERRRMPWTAVEKKYEFEG